MKTDIQQTEDIDVIMKAFYQKVQQNKTLAPFVKYINREQYLAVMRSFWTSILFAAASFEGNPVEYCRRLHKLKPITSQHFLTWLRLFEETVDEYFNGKNASLMKQRANGVARVLMLQISET